MYPRNNASPERLAIGQVVLIADGTIQSTGVAITVRGQGGAEAASGGTIAYGADNTVYYTPTQAETNFTSFVLIASKASCFSVSQTVVTTASATAGQVRLEGVTHTSAVVPTVTTLTNLPAITTNWLTATGIAASALNGKGNWNIGKTGYALVSTGLDAIAQSSTGMIGIAKAVWDRVLSGATHNIAASAGRRLRALQDFGLYEGGLVWIDTLNGTPGTTDFENGTVTNPVDNIADALIIRASIGLPGFHVQPGSSFTLAASAAGFEIMGIGYTIALGGQSLSGTLIQGATVSGNDSGTNAIHTQYTDCIMTTNTLGLHNTKDCDYEAGTTLAEAGTYTWRRPLSKVPGGGSPYVDFESAAETKGLNIRGIFGGIEIRNYNAGGGTHTMTLGGTGQRIFAATCAGGTLEQRGQFKETDNAGGAVTVVRDLVSQNSIDTLADTADLQTNQGNWLTATGFSTSAALATVDTNVDAIKAKTDDLTFTVANQVDSNSKSMNDVAITGAGTAGDPWT